MIDYLRNI